MILKETIKEVQRSARRGKLTYQDLIDLKRALLQYYSNVDDNHRKFEREHLKNLQHLVYSVSLSLRDDPHQRSEILEKILSGVANLFYSTSEDSIIWCAEDGATLLHGVAAMGHVEVMEALLQSARMAFKPKHFLKFIQKVDSNEKTALDYAIDEKMIECLRRAVDSAAPHMGSEIAEPVKEDQKRKLSATIEDVADARIILKKQHTQRVFRKKRLYTYEQIEEPYSESDSDAEHLQPLTGDLSVTEPSIILFRGISFLTGDVENTDKQQLKRINRTEEDLLSYGARYLLNNGEQQPAQIIISRFREMSETDRNKLIQSYIQNMSDFKKIQHKNTDNNNSPLLDVDTLNHYGFVSFDLSAKIAGDYAMRIKCGSKEQTKIRQYPNYDKNGKPHHRCAGVIIAVVCPVQEWDESSMFYVRRHWANDQLRLNYFVALNNEVIIAGGVPAKQVMLQQPLVMPDFSKPWKKEYVSLYNYSKNDFDKIVKEFSNYFTDPGVIRQRLLEQKIMLHIRDHAAKMLEEKVSVFPRAYPGLKQGEFTDSPVSFKESKASKAQQIEREVEEKHSTKNTQTSADFVDDLSENPNRLFDMTKRFLMNGQLDQAQQVCIRLLNIDSGNTDYLLLLKEITSLLDAQQVAPVSPSTERENAFFEKNEAQRETDFSLLEAKQVTSVSLSKNCENSFFKMIEAQEKTTLTLFEAKQYQDICTLMQRIIHRPEFLDQFEKLYRDTRLENADRVAKCAINLESMLIDYASSLCEVHFNNANSENVLVNNISHFRELLEVMEKYMILKQGAEPWLQNLKGGDIYATLEIQNKCRYMIDIFEEKSRLGNTAFILNDILLVHLDNFLSSLIEDVSLAAEMSADLAMLLPDLIRSMTTLLDLRFGQTKELSAWLKLLEELADDIVERVDGEMPEREGEHFLRLLVIRIYEICLQRINSDSYSGAFFIPEPVAQQYNLRAALLGQYVEMVRVGLSMNQADVADHYTRLSMAMHAVITNNPLLTSEQRDEVQGYWEELEAYWKPEFVRLDN